MFKVLSTALAFCLVLMSAPVMAQDTPYAVVNVDRVMTQTKAAKSIEKQLKAKTEDYSKEFSKRERELREAQEKLVEETRTLSKDSDESKIKAFEEKRKEFEKNKFETQKLFKERRSTLSSAVNEGTALLQKEMFEATATIAEEEGYRIVFDRKSVVIVEEALDITDKVVKKVDKALPEVKLKIKD